MKRVCNDEVAQAWLEGREAVSHTGNLRTDGKKIYSYDLQIGDTSDGKKIVRDYTAMGSYGFRSQTTSCHVGLLRWVPGHETQPIVI